MKKVILEQPKPKPGAQPTRGGSSTQTTTAPTTPDTGGSVEAPPQDTTPTGSSTSVPAPATSTTSTPAKVETKREGLEYFTTFVFKDKEGKEFKFSDDDKSEVLDLLPKFTNINGKKYDNDDAFVRASIYYLLKKGKPVFSVTYLNDAKTTIQLDENKNIGLGILLEQIETTIYVAKGEGNNFTITNDKKRAMRSVWAKPGEVKNEPKPTASAPAAPTGKTETNTTTPAQDMGVTPKPEMIQKVTEKQGEEGLQNALNPEQWKLYSDYMDKGYTADKPEDKLLSAYEVVDLNTINAEVFPQEFKVYRIKKLDVNSIDAYAESLSDQDVNKKACRQTIKLYVDTALDRKLISDRTRKNLASFIISCKAQFRDGFDDFKKTEKRLDTIQNKFVGPQYCKYKINFDGNGNVRGSVGCADNLLEIE